MSYEPTNWKSGDVVTSAKLNKLEQGVASSGGVLVVHTDENGVLDKTWQEIGAAASLGVVVLPAFGQIMYLSKVVHNPPIGSTPEKWRIIFASMVDSINNFLFDAESADSYPSYVGE